MFFGEVGSEKMLKIKLKIGEYKITRYMYKPQNVQGLTETPRSTEAEDDRWENRTVIFL